MMLHEEADEEMMEELNLVKTVDVLGVPYAIIEGNKAKDPALEKADGYCDHTVKVCVIDNLLKTPDSVADIEAYKKQVTTLQTKLMILFLMMTGCSAVPIAGRVSKTVA